MRYSRAFAQYIQGEASRLTLSRVRPFSQVRLPVRWHEANTFKYIAFGGDMHQVLVWRYDLREGEQDSSDSSSAKSTRASRRRTARRQPKSPKIAVLDRTKSVSQLTGPQRYEAKSDENEKPGEHEEAASPENDELVYACGICEDESIDTLDFGYSYQPGRRHAKLIHTQHFGHTVSR